MKAVKFIIPLVALVGLVSCGSEENPEYTKFISVSQTNEAKTQPYSSAKLKYKVSESSESTEIDFATYTYTSGQWVADYVIGDEFVNYVNLKGSSLKDPISTYKQIAAEYANKDKESVAEYSSAYGFADTHTVAEFRLDISGKEKYHEYHYFRFDEYGLLTKLIDEVSNKPTVEVEITYSK